MPDYTSPTMSGIVYSFVTGGYDAPTISGVPFRFGLRPSYQQTADLKSVIEASPRYCEEAYSYVKDRRTYVVGYGAAGVQILKGQPIYGGIRDLCTSIYVNPAHADLGAYIRAVSGQGDLGAYIKSTIQSYRDLGAFAGGHPPGELPGFIRPTIQDTKDLGSIIDGTFFHGDKDLHGIMNIIELRDLPASLIGEYFKGTKDLGAFAGGHPPADLGALAGGHLPADLGAYIYAPIDLPAYLLAVYAKDLPAFIRGSLLRNLGAYINPIPPGDLPAFIHGWATKDLGGLLNGVYGPYDIQAYLNTIPPKDLGAYIKGYKGIEIPIDLRGIIESWYFDDLGAYLFATKPADLGAYIEVVGAASDLGARIYPKTILLKKAVYVPLLEHKDLWAVINFQCFNSGFKELLGYVYPIQKSDLAAYVIGLYGNRTADTIRDLTAVMGVEDYSVQDKISVGFFPDVQRSTSLVIRFGSSYVHRSTTWDTLDLLLIDPLYRDLGAIVTGTYRYRDLAAQVYGEWDWNYSQLPDYIRPKTREVVIDLDNPTEARGYIERFVEIMFDMEGVTPFKYFYVDGDKKVYRIDRSRHWTIWGTSYERVEDQIIDKINYRRKYIFKLNTYDKMDDAIRDLIDRVSWPSRYDLGAKIDGGLPPHKDMKSYINGLQGPYTWSKNLHASISSPLVDLSASITGV